MTKRKSNPKADASENPARVMERAFMAGVPEHLQSPDAKATFDALAAYCDEPVTAARNVIVIKDGKSTEVRK